MKIKNNNNKDRILINKVTEFQISMYQTEMFHFHGHDVRNVKG